MQQSLEDLFKALSKENAKSAEQMLTGKEERQEDTGAHSKGLWQLLGGKEGR